MYLIVGKGVVFQICEAGSLADILKAILEYLLTYRQAD